MYADRGVKLDEAVTLLKKAVKFDPQNGAYLDSLAWAYLQAGAVCSGRRLRPQGRARMGNDPTVLDHLGEIEAKGGKLQQAIVEWQKSLAVLCDIACLPRPTRPMSPRCTASWKGRASASPTWPPAPASSKGRAEFGSCALHGNHVRLGVDATQSSCVWSLRRRAASALRPRLSRARSATTAPRLSATATAWCNRGPSAASPARRRSSPAAPQTTSAAASPTPLRLRRWRARSPQRSASTSISPRPLRWCMTSAILPSATPASARSTAACRRTACALTTTCMRCASWSALSSATPGTAA
jgi:hypothetical protein